MLVFAAATMPSDATTTDFPLPRRALFEAAKDRLITPVRSLKHVRGPIPDHWIEAGESALAARTDVVGVNFQAKCDFTGRHIQGTTYTSHSFGECHRCPTMQISEWLMMRWCHWHG